MDRDFIMPMPECEGTPELVSQPLSLKAVKELVKSHKTSDSKKEPLVRAGHDLARIHFTPDKEGDVEKPTLLTGGLGYHDPIEIHASERFTEIHMNNIVEEGLYNIRLAVSLKHLNIERIESITFNQRHDDRCGAMEVFTKSELEDILAASETDVVVLGLHRQYCVEEGLETHNFFMEIRTTTRPLPLNNPGHIELHYMELLAIQYDNDVDCINDAVFKVHRPFLWSIDVEMKEDPGNVRTVPGRIIYYMVSGDGNYAATLSTRSNILQLDMWDLKVDPECTADTESEGRKCRCELCQAPFTPRPCGQYITQISKPIDSDMFFDDWDEDLENDPSPLQIAVSYDASRVVLMDAEKKYLSDHPFQVFEFWGEGAELNASDDYIGPDLPSTSGMQDRPDLRNFCGYGKFHFTSSKSRDLRDELFITCDGKNVDIFNIDREYGLWEHVRRITLAEKDEDSIPMPRRLIEGLSNKYFHFLSRNNIQMVGKLETGKLLHGMASEGTGSLSSDGTLMLCHQYPNIITTRWSRTGTILGKAESAGNLYSSGPSFIKNDNQILIPISKPDDSYGKGRLGMMLDTATLSIVERVSYTSRYHEQPPHIAGDHGQFLYCSHGSKLDLVRLQDILVAPYPQSKYLCDDECLEVSAKLDETGVVWESKGAKEAMYIDANLNLTVEFEEVSERQYAVVVSITNGTDVREVVRIPPLMIGEILTKYGIHVDKANFQLFVVCDLFAMMWKLPATFEGDATLQSTLWTRSFSYKEKIVYDEVLETYKYPSILKVCNHGRIIVTSTENTELLRKLGESERAKFKDEPEAVEVKRRSVLPMVGTPLENKPKAAKKDRSLRGLKTRPPKSKIKPVKSSSEISKNDSEDKEQRYRIPPPGSTTFPLYNDGSFSRDPYRFFNGLYMLMHLFHVGQEPLQQAIMQFIGLHINRTVEANGRTRTILRIICRRVNAENYTLTETFLKALFNSPHVRWVPKPHLKRYMNPISLLLKRCQELPRAINLAQIVINYCVRMAKKERDPIFKFPVLETLHELLKLKERPPDLVTNILRDLAYCPVQERSFIIDHASIAHPPSFLGLFGTPTKQPIYAYKDPVFRLDRSLLYKEHDPLNENFTRDLFVASFDMLWRSPDDEEDDRTPLERVIDYGPIPSPSWIRVAFHFFMCELRLRPQRRVEFFDLPLEALDNPAIAALIEFKWNTIGYKYWLVRFFWQSIFYVLVVVAVLMQVYNPTQNQAIKYLFSIAIVMGFFFLLLEIRQFFSNPRRYVTSPYNVVDLLAFGLPLVGGVVQVANIENKDNKGHRAVLSFAVLFVFLHILFELRVNQNVCHFVAIIVRIVGKIKVFFSIFAFGILAFAIAMLHLLRGCPYDDCSEEVENLEFGRTFPEAVSMTYFFMGGIWDPVEDEFKRRGFSFHIMIIFYFFFTTILLLNVLIALMNVAFTDGDVSWELIWKESRLRCIEGAETVSHNIPDYREAHTGIFPTRIYYFGTHKDMKEYHEKYSDRDKNDDDDGGDDANGGINLAGTGMSELARANTIHKHGAGSKSSAYVTRHSKVMDVKVIKQTQEEMKVEQDKRHEELKKELKQSHDQMKALQTQLEELMATLKRVPLPAQ